MQYITVSILPTKNGGVKHHIMMRGNSSGSSEQIVEKNEAREHAHDQWTILWHVLLADNVHLREK